MGYGTSARRGLRGRMRSDEGTSLIELVVGMSLLSIFMSMFTGAVVMMNNAENKAQAVSLTSTQLNQAFLNLDKTVRYATAISTPGQGTTGDWYVELRTTNTGTDQCMQLRVDIATQQLQQRTWTVTNAVASSASGWLPTASGIANGNAVSGAATQPFYLPPPLASAKFQQLRINLTSPSGSGSSATTSASSFTFTALNSTVPVSTSPICQQQARP
jgi:Tfp pilus assembly protein PilW